MKKNILFVLAFFILPKLYATVEYRLTYNSGTATYTVAVRSTAAYSGPLARLTGSSQVTIVAPDVDGVGAGTFMATNLTSAAGTNNLSWASSQINSPAQNTSKDYLFFAPANASTYTPFNIAANTWVDIFTFQSGGGCIGDLYLYDNNAAVGVEPMNGQSTYNTKNNFKTLGGGNVNLWASNASGAVACNICAAEAGTLSY